MLNFVEMKGIPVSDDISSSPRELEIEIRRFCRRRETSGADKRSVGKSLRRVHASLFAAMRMKSMGMMSSNQMCRKSPPHFSEFSSRIHNDGGLTLYSPSVGIHSNLLQHNPVVFFSHDDHCLLQCLPVNLADCAR